MSVHMHDKRATKSALMLFSAAATAGVLAMTAASASASPYLSVDFESPNVAGSVPTSPVPSTVGGTAGYSVNVVDSSTTPADPFAASGNQSLWIQSPVSIDTSSTSVQIAWTGASGGLTSGTFSGDYYLPNASQYAEIRLGVPGMFSSGSNIGPMIGLSGNAVKIWGSSNYTLDQTAPAGTKHTIVIHFDTATHTFTGTVDGIAMTATSGATTTTVFPFLSNVSSIDTLGVDAGYTTASREAFFDNLSITPVPEPTTLGLLGLGAMGLLARRRRK